MTLLPVPLYLICCWSVSIERPEFSISKNSAVSFPFIIFWNSCSISTYLQISVFPADQQFLLWYILLSLCLTGLLLFTLESSLLLYFTNLRCAAVCFNFLVMGVHCPSVSHSCCHAPCHSCAQCQLQWQLSVKQQNWHFSMTSEIMVWAGGGLNRLKMASDSWIRPGGSLLAETLHLPETQKNNYTPY